MPEPPAELFHGLEFWRSSAWVDIWAGAPLRTPAPNSAASLVRAALMPGSSVNFPQITEICDLLEQKPEEGRGAVELLAAALSDTYAPFRKKLKALTITNEMMYDVRCISLFRNIENLQEVLGSLRGVRESGLGDHVDENIRMLATEIHKACFAGDGVVRAREGGFRSRLGNAVKGNLAKAADAVKTLRREGSEPGMDKLGETNAFYFDEEHKRWRERGVPDEFDNVQQVATVSSAPLAPPVPVPALPASSVAVMPQIRDMVAAAAVPTPIQNPAANAVQDAGPQAFGVASAFDAGSPFSGMPNAAESASVAAAFDPSSASQSTGPCTAPPLGSPPESSFQAFGYSPDTSSLPSLQPSSVPSLADSASVAAAFGLSMPSEGGAMATPPPASACSPDAFSVPSAADSANVAAAFGLSMPSEGGAMATPPPAFACSPDAFSAPSAADSANVAAAFGLSSPPSLVDSANVAAAFGLYMPTAGVPPPAVTPPLTQTPAALPPPAPAALFWQSPANPSEHLAVASAGSTAVPSAFPAVAAAFGDSSGAFPSIPAVAASPLQGTWLTAAASVTGSSALVSSGTSLADSAAVAAAFDLAPPAPAAASPFVAPVMAPHSHPAFPGGGVTAAPPKAMQSPFAGVAAVAAAFGLPPEATIFSSTASSSSSPSGVGVAGPPLLPHVAALATSAHVPQAPATTSPSLALPAFSLNLPPPPIFAMPTLGATASVPPPAAPASSTFPTPSLSFPTPPTFGSAPVLAFPPPTFRPSSSSPAIGAPALAVPAVFPPAPTTQAAAPAGVASLFG